MSGIFFRAMWCYRAGGHGYFHTIGNLLHYFSLLSDFQAAFSNGLSAETFTPFFCVSLFISTFASKKINDY